MTGPLDPVAREPGQQSGAGSAAGPGQQSGAGSAAGPGQQSGAGSGEGPGQQSGAGSAAGPGQEPGPGQAVGAGRSPGYPRQPITVFLDGLAAGAPAPAAGSAIALVLAEAAALCAKAARLSGRRLGAARVADLTIRAENLRAAATDLMDQDALAYAAVITASRQRDPERLAIALSAASDVPMRLIEAAAETADLAADLAAECNRALRGDAAAAALLAEAAGRAATRLVRINLAASPEDPRLGRAADLLAGLAAAARQADQAAGAPPELSQVRGPTS
ncbi:MAG: cyclodeaminase/cyclohydrolase family protein [Streptosporangiaceae bacterium]